MKKLFRCFVVFALAIIQGNAMGQVTIQGGVFEQDAITPIEGASVTFSGITQTGDTIVFQFITDTLGVYNDTLTEGVYQAWASAEGYETNYLADSLEIAEGQILTNIDFILNEIYHSVRYVAARQYTDDLARISWSMHDPLLVEDFETGDFSHFNWTNNFTDYPWAIDSTHAYEGNYCIKSTCEGIGDGLSQIEVSVYVPFDGQMSFFSKISSESPWDMGRFYLDGVKKMECSGEESWTEHQFDITAGEHVFRWTYIKDASTDLGDDCFYVDNIHFYLEDSAKDDPQRSFQYYDLFRSRFEETPVMLASHLTDTVFMDMNWGSLPWGQYRWGVSCYYEGNRNASDTIWSAYLDKDMTTTFQMDVTTNIGLSANGAEVLLQSENNDYQGVVNSDGHLSLAGIYRDNYNVHVHLDGFVDYVSDSLISIMEPTQMDVMLYEEINDIDSLYVSPTGWAFWSLSETQNRDLQYFEIQLNGTFIDTTTTTYFQFDVEQLTAGEIYLAQVRPVYLSDTCDWHPYEWTYRPCSDFQGTTEGLSWSLHNEALQLSWDYPEGESLLGAVLYRDGAYLDFTEENTYLDATVELHGEVTYCLRLVYDGMPDSTLYSMSCEECTTAVFPAYCDPPMELDGISYYEDEEDYGALISWGERPDPINQWLHYDNGEFKRSLGGDDEPRIFWAIRFDAEDLTDYLGSSLKKVSLYDVGAGTYQLWIYIGGDTEPQNLVRSQNMTLTGSNLWHEETVTPALEIPENEPLWIVVGQQGVARPAAACQDMEDANGRWVSLDGETWTDMHTFNMHYTWMLRAFVTNQSGRSIALGKEGYILQQYNLYRSYDNSDYQIIASIPALEGQVYYEYRDNLSTDPNEYVYYRLTALYLSDEGETCESDYATTLNNPDLNYVVIDLWSTEELSTETLKLYPNPTDGLITIELDDMQNVSIYNALGQVIMNKHVDSNLVRFDMSAFENGIYWLQVATQNTVTTRAFVLSR